LLGSRSFQLDEAAAGDAEGTAEAILRTGDTEPVDAISQCWQEVRSPRPELPDLLRATAPHPWQPEACRKVVDGIRGALAGHIRAGEDMLRSRVKQRAKRWVWFRWLALVVPLAWFPIVQPILAASFKTVSSPGSLSGWMQIAYTAVVLLGATHWLKSIGVVVAVYALMALAVYARARWTARRFIRRTLLPSMGVFLEESLESALRDPVESRVVSLRRMRDELARIRGALRQVGRV
jgi:hypothetical protein